MAYDKQTWVDGPEGGTPLSADRLNHIEEGLEANIISLEESTAPLTASVVQTGTSTLPGTISAKVLADEIDHRVAAAIAAIA